MNHEEAEIIKGQDNEDVINGMILKHGAVKAVQMGIKAGQSGSPVTKKLNTSLAQLLEHRDVEFDGSQIRLHLDDTTDALAVTEMTMEVFRNSAEIGNTGHWLLGNIAYEMTKLGWDMEQFIEDTQISYSIINAARRTFEIFQAKRYPMPFGAHRVIAQAQGLSEAHRHAIATIASTNGYAIDQIVKMLKLAKASVKDKTDFPTTQQLDEAATTTPAKPAPKKPEITEQYLVIRGNNSELLEGPIGDHIIADATAVYQISRVIKES